MTINEEISPEKRKGNDIYL